MGFSRLAAIAQIICLPHWAPNSGWEAALRFLREASGDLAILSALERSRPAAKIVAALLFFHCLWEYLNEVLRQKGKLRVRFIIFRVSSVLKGSQVVRASVEESARTGGGFPLPGNEGRVSHWEKGKGIERLRNSRSSSGVRGSEVRRASGFIEREAVSAEEGMGSLGRSPSRARIRPRRARPEPVNPGGGWVGGWWGAPRFCRALSWRPRIRRSAPVDRVRHLSLAR